MTIEFKNLLTEKFITAHEKATTIRVIPHIFPWKWMGCTDEEFLTKKTHFINGSVIPEEHKIKLLACIRGQEEELRARRDKVKGKAPKQVQLELW